MYLCPDRCVLADREVDEVPSLEQERRPVPPRRRRVGRRALGLPHRARLKVVLRCDQGSFGDFGILELNFQPFSCELFF